MYKIILMNEVLLRHLI